MYSVDLSDEAEEMLSKLPRDVQKTARRIMKGMEIVPVPHQSRALDEAGDRRKIPFKNNYRIVFYVVEETKQVKVDLVGHRKDVYRRMNRMMLE